MRSISAAPDLVAGLKAARVRVVPLLNCSKYRLVSSCDVTRLVEWVLGEYGTGEGGVGGGVTAQQGDARIYNKAKGTKNKKIDANLRM